VNLASRLESACKQYGAHILASDFTVKALRGTYRMRELDLVVVKGKTKPVAIYEILDYHTDESYPQLPDALGYFRDALGRYRKREWGPARALFEKVLAINASDRAASLYLERCSLLEADPPGDDWSGVWVMQSK
jgi:adenylate cyclase